MSKLTDEIRQRGHWQFIVHPVRFDEKRIAFEDLFTTVERCVVELRGWDFPHIDRNKEHERGVDRVEQSSSWEHNSERWIFHQSGHFALLRALSEDWRDRSTWWPPRGGWEPGRALGLFDTLWSHIECYEFAARMSQAIPGDDDLRVSITLTGLRDRFLTNDSNRLPFLLRGNHRASIPQFSASGVHTRTALLSSVDRLAASDARDLFLRFAYAPGLEALEEWAKQLRAHQL